MKTCSKCGLEKDSSGFKQHRTVCKQCLKEEDAKRKQEDPEYLESCRAYHRNYYRDNAEHLREVGRKSDNKPENKKKKAKRYRDRRDARTPEQAAADRIKSNEAARAERKLNPERVRERGILCDTKKLAKFNLLKMDRPCYDCGGVFPPEAMDWDHLPGREKCFDIGTGIRAYSEETVIDEINKCQLVCSNCHRVRTKARMQKKGEE